LRKPWFTLAAWACFLLLALPAARRAPSLLRSGSGDIAGSPSLRADSLLRADFPMPYSQLLVLALRGGRTAEWDSSSLLPALTRAFNGLPEVAAAQASPDFLDPRLRPAPGSGAVIMIGVKAASVREAEQAIPKVRTAAEVILAPAKAADPGLEWAVTGRSALTYDLNLFNAKDVTRAETRVLPLTLIILLLAFGSLAAAAAPMLMGIFTTGLSLAAVGLLARHWPLSNLAQNVSGMIGMAVGIDYSLLLIHRYREILSGIPAGEPSPNARLARRKRAMTAAIGTAGKAVFYSGLTVLIGLGGLLFTPLMETQSIGWGGCAVVLASVACALTLLPPALVLLGPALDWPAASRRITASARGDGWERWSGWVMRRAPFCALAGAALVALMAWPGRLTRFGFPEERFLPAELEFMRGLRMLEDMRLGGLIAPVNVILTAGDSILTPSRIPDLLAFSARLRSDSAVGRIFGPLDLADHWPPEKYRKLYADPAAALERIPSIGEYFLSRDGRSLLMQILFKPGVGLDDAKRLARDIPGWMGIPGLRMEMGGQAVYYNDFDEAMRSAYAPCVAFVLIVSFAALLLFFGSPLVAFKALILNGLSVLAGYGMVVFVFQLGHGHTLFGTPGPSQVVPLTIPLLLFCILFGLSMDYEVFLISRIREAYAAGGDNTRAVSEGLAATGPTITSAALIMAAVFGAFAFARVVVAQMLGLGLAVAVLVDATLIRVLLLPALMKMAGRWNWWPRL
jgi:RND superfamily putative drug exporter